jgi:hypothetical protein
MSGLVLLQKIHDGKHTFERDCGHCFRANTSEGKRDTRPFCPHQMGSFVEGSGLGMWERILYSQDTNSVPPKNASSLQ